MKDIKKQSILLSILIFLITSLISVGSCFVFKKTQGETIQIIVIMTVLSFCVGFSYFYSIINELLDYDNQDHPIRIAITYFGGLVLSALFPLIDKGGWIFVCIGISIALFSNAMTGLCAVLAMITLSCLLSAQTSGIVMVVYLVPTVLGILLFSRMDEEFNVNVPIAITMLTLFLMEIAGFVILVNEKLSPEQFIMPIVNIVINTIVLFWVLKYVNNKIANKYRNKYLELNDQEYVELAKLKSSSSSEYYRAIHTAYLVERMANAIGCDVRNAKNCAYYHRIKEYYNYSDEEFVNFLTENEFPPEARTCLLDYTTKGMSITSKENCIVYVSDKFIYTLMLLFAKDKDKKVNYETLIDNLMEKDYVKNVLFASDMSMKDIYAIIEIMKKETLYYEFLR